jgi:hypothetical protein
LKRGEFSFARKNSIARFGAGGTDSTFMVLQLAITGETMKEQTA